MSVNWDDAALRQKVKLACKDAIDDATRSGVVIAKQNHWWVNRNSQLQSEIISESSQYDPARGWIIGKFGSTKSRGFYGLILEYKTPFLRPASDAAFSTLRSRIGSKLNA